MEPTGVTQPGGSIDADLEPGYTVGEYCVDGKLGQGGFGAVFKASHPLIGKVVAIKVLSMRFSVDREMVSRFVAEARAVNQIRHRNIIDIFSFGQLPDGRHYYVMEYMDGETLDRRLERAEMALVEAIPILRAIARALDAAHAKGIAHRDLKAENVFLGSDSDGSVFPKLLDFGIAKLMGPDDEIAHKTRTGAPMGTPYYMSPEQTRGRGVDHRTDHYAFGVLAYLMLTRKYPIDGEDYMTILMRQVSDDALPASSHVPALGEGVDRTLAWLMRKEPEDRPPDLMTAVRALEEAAGLQRPTTSVSSQTPSVLARIPSTPSKLAATTPSMAAIASAATMAPAAVAPVRRSHATLVAAIGVVVVGGAIGAFVMSRSSKQSATPDAAGRVMIVPDAGVPDAAPSAIAVPDATTAAVVDAAAANVTITLDGAPRTAEVRIGGQLFGTAPRVLIPRGSGELVLVLSSDGYLPLSIPIVPDHDQHVAGRLRARGGKPVPPTGSGSSEPTNDIDEFPKDKHP